MKARLVGTVPIGGALEFAVVDGEGKLFVNVEDTGEIAVVDTRARKLLTRFKLQGCEEPSGLYLPSADFTPPAQSGARPTPVAGSFQVLVLGP